MTRRDRQRRDFDRLIAVVISCGFVIAAVLIALLAPGAEERPLVTIYMQDDCVTCLEWAQYLNRTGFRAAIGARSEWAAVRSRVRVPPALRAPHTAVIDGFFVEGNVPAREIHRLLRQRQKPSVRGILVSGTPGGAPGVRAAVPETYTVFLVHASGILEPLRTYNHASH